MRGFFLAIVPATLLYAIPALGQEPLPTRPTPPVTGVLEPPASLEDNFAIEPATPLQPANAPKNDRLFFVMPNYSTVENSGRFQPPPPLSAKCKFKLSAKTMSDPVTISFLGTLALIGQARNTDSSYGQELQGYAKRYGKLYADAGIGTLMTASVFPTLLHQDPPVFSVGNRRQVAPVVVFRDTDLLQAQR